MPPTLEPGTPFEAFVLRVTDLWQEYVRLGPGRLAESRADGLEQQSELALQCLQEWGASRTDGSWQAGLEAVRVVTRLAVRCVRRPQGLAFVSGEAGLIPDQRAHATLEASLKILHELVDLRRPQLPP